MYTLPTRPWNSPGTARWRMEVEVVPQTAVCTPNTKKVAKATAGVVVSARVRWVSVSMIRPTRMMSARLTRRSTHAYDHDPRMPPTALAVVSSPNPISRSNVVLIREVTVFPSLPLQSESDRIFNYLEAAYPDILSPSIGDAGIVDGYAYRYYSGSDSYVGSKDGKVYYRSPTQTNNQITEIGSVADWLALAQSAGY